jgi:small subunit ribosomal protein S6
MNKYEAMCIIKPDLPEDQRKALFGQIADIVTKNSGKVISADVWAEKRPLTFTIKKQREGVYYLVVFNAPSDSITKMKYSFNLNENIIRVLIVRPE